MKPKKSRPSEYVRKLRAEKQRALHKRLKKVLLALPREELLRIALEDKRDYRHSLARDLISSREGKPWKKIREALERNRGPVAQSPKGRVGGGKFPAPKPNKPKKEIIYPYRLPSPPPNIGQDYLKPISSEYGIPEYDLE